MSSICRVDGCDRTVRARGCCSTHYSRWYRGLSVEVDPVFRDGLGVCECSISRPDPKCCTICGYPSVHRMAPHIRDRAIAKMPRLADQIIFTVTDRGAA